MEFFNYLQECCRIIEKILLKEDRGIPLYRQVCVWNKLLEKDNDKDRAHLLGSLIDIFDLEHRDLENISIEKVDDSNNALRISNPEFCILIELDREEKKAIAKLLDKNKIKYEYAIHEFDSDNILIESVHSEKEGL